MRAQGCAMICGVDEVGRGPLAGPVVAAAVILDPRHPIAGLDDSKALTASRRHAVYDAIMAQAVAVAVASRSAASIDDSDIRKATLGAMAHCVNALAVRADGVLVDGRDVPPGLARSVRARAIVGGDGLSASIAAASVVAKVSRDAMMVRLCDAHPPYGFSGHKGYGAAAHRAAIARAGGVARVHRFSFRPLRTD